MLTGNFKKIIQFNQYLNNYSAFLAEMKLNNENKKTRKQENFLKYFGGRVNALIYILIYQQQSHLRKVFTFTTSARISNLTAIPTAVTTMF